MLSRGSRDWRISMWRNFGESFWPSRDKQACNVQWENSQGRRTSMIRKSFWRSPSKAWNESSAKVCGWGIARTNRGQSSLVSPKEHFSEIGERWQRSTRHFVSVNRSLSRSIDTESCPNFWPCGSGNCHWSWKSSIWKRLKRNFSQKVPSRNTSEHGLEPTSIR